MGMTVWFLVDTGSCITLLSRDDANRLGVPLNISSSKDAHVVGLGGSWRLNCKPLEATIGICLREGAQMSFRWELRVPTESESLRPVSVLGLDLLAFFEKVLIKNGHGSKVELSSTRLLELRSARLLHPQTVS